MRIESPGSGGGSLDVAARGAVTPPKKPQESAQTAQTIGTQIQSDAQKLKSTVTGVEMFRAEAAQDLGNTATTTATQIASDNRAAPPATENPALDVLA